MKPLDAIQAATVAMPRISSAGQTKLDARKRHYADLVCCQRDPLSDARVLESVQIRS